ncbi:hypothetical protein RRG08_020271 [Elysia crispata]|uniref:Uncharacterized protein n=1 Tax=Elysia crispata TaxID=231223 RepID=A0AAE0YYB5_9GAST|nr:hypothetical protein RRG08_020271 [Elysia crispata]
MRSSQAGVTDLASRHVTPEGGVDSGLGERAVKRGSCQMSPDLSRAPRRVSIVHVQNLTVPPRPLNIQCIIHQALMVIEYTDTSTRNKTKTNAHSQVSTPSSDQSKIRIVTRNQGSNQFYHSTITYKGMLEPGSTGSWCPGQTTGNRQVQRISANLDHLHAT